MALYLFGPFEIDGDRFELRRAGVAVRVEPRVLELIVYLAARPERIVSKDELIAEVWGGRFVTESAVSRCVAEARRALSAEGLEEAPIRTIHGRGYRWVAGGPPPAPSAAVENEAPPVGARPSSSRGAQRRSDLACGEGPAGPVANVEIATGPTGLRDDGWSPPGPALPVTTKHAAFAAATSTPSRRAWLLAVMVAAAAVTLVTVALWRRAPARSPPETATTGRAPLRTIAILPLSVPGGDRELQLLGLSLGDLLSQRLQAVPGLAVRDPSQVGGSAVSDQEVAAAARRAGARFALGGSLRRAERQPRARLQLTLFDVRSSRDVVKSSVFWYELPLLAQDGDLRALLAAREGIVREALQTLAPVFVEQPSPSSDPRSAEAFRLYLMAVERIGELACAGTTPVDLLHQSLAIDDRYASAWEALGFAEYNEAWACGGASAHQRAALAALDRALAIAPSMRALGFKAVMLVELGRLAEAHELLQAALRRYPRNPDLRFERAYALLYGGQLDLAAREVLTAVGDDPGLLTARGWTPNALLYQGKIDRFLALLPETDAPLYAFYRGLAELRRGRVAAARTALKPALRSSPADVFGRLSQALLADIDGEHEDARFIVRQLWRQRRELGAQDGEMTYKLALLLAMAGDRDEALARLEEAIDEGFFCVECFERDPTWAPLRSDARYRTALDRARARQARLREELRLRGVALQVTAVEGGRQRTQRPA
ncbi:MAG TPA: winged helix-turn-helix domain-containing protein [Thermoanaerobaculia bacterium]|nr:winged helix-turn-helix domain-containing protein [Thermoanaerobaculia bacterium]